MKWWMYEFYIFELQNEEINEVKIIAVEDAIKAIIIILSIIFCDPVSTFNKT